jgi:predicted nuclease with RNAse H fold
VSAFDAPTAERFIGIDVGARQYHAVLLSPGAHPLSSARFTDPAVLAAWARDYSPEGGIAAIDAPLRTSEGLMLDAGFRSTLSPPPPDNRYLTYRVCDYELARRRLPLYRVPYRYADCPEWMRAGFAAYDALLATGRWSVFDGDPAHSLLTEVYPFAAFAALLGHIPPPKQTPEGREARVAAIAGRLADGADLTRMSHHELDATAAALTALSLRTGQATWVGHPREALIVLPAPLRERYELASSAGPKAERSPALTPEKNASGH